MGFSVDQSY